MLSKHGKNLIALAALVFTAWASLATSQAHKSIENADLYIISDCVVPTFEQAAHSSGGALITGVDYTQIGFPNGIVRLGQDNSGIYNNGTANVNRTCTETYGNNTSGNDRYVYSCFDNGAYACSIVIINQ